MGRTLAIDCTAVVENESGPNTPLRKNNGTGMARVRVVRVDRSFRAIPRATPAATNTASVSRLTPTTIGKLAGRSPAMKTTTASTTTTAGSSIQKRPTLLPPEVLQERAG